MPHPTPSSRSSLRPCPSARRYGCSQALLLAALAAVLASSAPASHAQDRPPANAPGAPGGPGGARGPGGPGGPGGGPGGGMFGGVQPPTEYVKQFDKDGNQWLNAEERKAAREFLRKERAEGRGPRRPGPPGGRGGRGGPGGGEPPAKVQAGPKLSPGDVKNHPDAPLYAPDVVRTFFLEFDGPDWEAELSDFYKTDVEVPAKLTVDGKVLPDVGVHFRGASSFFTVAESRKRSLNLTVDFVHKDQRLGGYRTLNLLNAHTDPSFLRTVLYLEVARDYLPAPRANFVRLVINGESWGIYASAQQFNTDFTRDTFQSTKGARWKVPGSPNGRGSLAYLGADPAPYKRIYAIKSKDEPKSWEALVALTRTLNQTLPDQLEAALDPIFDIDGALRFLALENVFINGDGYWIRSSDFHLYRDEKGRFHIVPHDANETFRAPEGPGMGGRGGGAGGIGLSPLTGADNDDKPLIAKLLAVPALKQRYLGHVRSMAETWLDWKKLGPIVEKYHDLIAEDVKTDTHKLYTWEAFENSVSRDTTEETFRGPRPSLSLKSFADQRRAYLLGLSEVRQAPLPAPRSPKP